MGKDRLRVVFVGVGSMGQCAHLANYAVIPECEVAALAELREDVGEKVARRYGVERVYGDYREMLEKETYDAVVCVQQFTRHGVILPEVLSAGKPVFIEKPLAGSVEVGARILDAERKSGTFLMVGYHKRSDLGTVRAKAEIDGLKASGEAGAMRYVRITMPPGDWIQGGFDGLIKGSGEGAKLEWDEKPTGWDEETYKRYVAFINYYVHQVNLMRHLMGENYRVKYAERTQAVLVVESESGVAGVIEMSPYQTSREWQESALVGFEKAYVKLDLPAPLAANRAGRVEIMRDTGGEGEPVTLVPHVPAVNAMRQQARNFIAAARGEAAVTCTAAEAFLDLEAGRDYIELPRKAN